ncbi:MAG: hypothetical protein ACI9DC_001591 [Gammaproteobacteria bacterium]|jgi:uncharacterized protein YaiL (DUF2058 family)
MANSIQDQLLKAGLATQDQVRSTRTGKRKQRKAGKPRDDSVQRQAAQRQTAQAERDRALNAKREADRVNKETRLRIREMVLAASAKVKPEAAEIPYNVLHGSKLRRIYVTAEQRDGLGCGKLAIATAKGRHHVVSMELAAEITQLMPDYFVYRPKLEDDVAKVADESDPYADYKVPDDLMW